MCPLDGLGVLVVEDLYFVALELSRMLRQLGAEVIGPVARLPLDASLADRPIDVALLDVKIGGGTSFPLVDEMARRGVPVAFITGYAAEALPEAYRSLTRLDKPVDCNKLAATVLRLAGRPEGVAA